MKSNVGRLSLMMFLQYAVWGAWLPLAARYLTAPVAEGGLGFTGTQMGTILGLAGSIGAIASPFIAGQLADRYFSTERFLAALLAIGGVIKWITASQHGFSAWLVLSILYSVVYMPTLALSNSMAFANLDDRDHQFPKVRVWGTIGWIRGELDLSDDLSADRSPPAGHAPVPGRDRSCPTSPRGWPIRSAFSAIISFGYAVYCLSLPHTPPRKDATEKLAFKKAFALLKERSFAVLVLASLPISIIHQVYFLQTPPFFSHLGLGDSQIGPAMTIGQFSEIAVMAALGALLARLGFRKVITIGAFAYFVRYAIWSFPAVFPVSVLVGSQFPARDLLRLLLCRGLHLHRPGRTGRRPSLGPNGVRDHHPGRRSGAGRPALRLPGRQLCAVGRSDRLRCALAGVSLIGLAAAVFFWAFFRERKTPAPA
jgi:hypothetical protein